MITGSKSHQMGLVQSPLKAGADVNTVGGLGRQSLTRWARLDQLLLMARANAADQAAKEGHAALVILCKKWPVLKNSGECLAVTGVKIGIYG